MRMVDDGKRVGPTSCMMQEIEFNLDGKEYVRVDLGISGTVEGYIMTSGPYHEYMTNGPNLVFHQAGTSSSAPQLAIAEYDMMKGAAVFLIYPKNKTDWNGKMWVTAHGRGRSFKNGSLKVWNEYLDPDNPADFDKIEKSILSKGYAMAVTNRTSTQDIGEIKAVLANGNVVDWVAFNEAASLMKDYTFIAESVLQSRLGSEPSRTYYIGHSAGARMGRSINYTPGVNMDEDGNRVFDGFLNVESATGLWLPIIMQDGKDVLFDEEAEKAAFTPQIEVGGQMNTKIWVRTPERPDWVSDNYLVNKRTNAKTLLDKGFGDKFRVFEVRQWSHSTGAGLPNGRNGKVRIVDVSMLLDGIMDMLDNLVEGRPVPPSRSDWAAISDVDGNGTVDNPAVSLPEVACPLGVFYPYPEAGSSTSFAGFTGEHVGDGIEPLDAQGHFVDMNRNGAWDFRETPTQAWRRLGLIGENEDFTRERYVECIRTAAEKLHADGFFSEETIERYVQQARQQDLNLANLDNF